MNLYKFNNKKYLYKSPKIPDINKTIIFADDTASGRPSPYIENQIVKHILPYYSNTHSNAYCGILMKEYIQKTRDYIRTTFNLKKYHKILFSGNGCTGAINHLCNSINYKKYNKVYIYITKDEHYSNYLPWYEISRHYDNVQVSIIKKADDLKNMTTCPKCLNIISINGCSNVTGKIRNLKPFINIKNKFENSYLLVDMAACAPYIKLDVSNLDGIYVSMHKFLGGVSTPGLLIVNEKIFNSDHPYCPGGGCVQKANTKEIIYETDLEKKESAGTPNIVGIIKIGYVLELKEYSVST
jgi:selenocysteine lyase/cysteine desulfurase